MKVNQTSRRPSVLSRLERGTTLIEVLVAMVIVAIGLLGVAGLQMRSLGIQKDAHGRGLATQMAMELADMMRANVNAVHNDAFQFAAAYPAAPTPGPGAATDCAAVVCTDAQLAAFDLRKWFVRLTGSDPNNAAFAATPLLPGGWANITKVAGDNKRWDITVMWQEVRWVDDGTTNARAALDKAGGNNGGCVQPAGGVPLAVPANVSCVTVRVWP